MIQTPINVRPQNYSIDSTDLGEVVDFTFKGDFCSGVWCRIYDYHTGEMVHEQYRYDYSDNEPLGYNDDSIFIPHTIYADCVNGGNYILQMLLFQKNPFSTMPICDIPVISGRVEEKQNDYGDLSRIVISGGITSIYTWGKNGNGYYPTDSGNSSFTRMIIKIGNEEREIVSYVDDTEEGVGIITVNSPFTTVTPNSIYHIYSNYLITPQYYFECRSKPTITFEHSETKYGISCDGVYSQSEDDLIKHYQLSLMWSNNSLFSNLNLDKTEIVETSDVIYSQQIKYYFRFPYRHDEDLDDVERESYSTDYYKIICNVTTQSGQVAVIESEPFALAPFRSDAVDNTLYAYDLQWDKALGRVVHILRGYGSAGWYTFGEYELTREDLNSGEIVQLRPHHFDLRTHAELVGYDVLAPTHGNYKYTLKLYNENGQIVVPNISPTYTGIGHFPCNVIETNECAYYITELNEETETLGIYFNKGTNKKRFTTGDTWVFRGDIQDTTVTNNLDRETHIGYNRYISNTSTNVNYMSGTLTTLLGYVNCANREYIDDITLVNAWRKFITQKKSFLLKSQKGDVWIVNIVNAPTTTYAESIRTIPTTISFDWAESYGLDEVVIYDMDAE